ncbi:MAG: alpha-glucuronidase [Bacillota bacterium]
MRWESCWLTEAAVPETLQTPLDTARWELAQAGAACALTVDAALYDGYEIAADGGAIKGGETGVLYGAYRMLEWKRVGRALPRGRQAPAFALRMLDHWDAMDGHVERGYAGRSIFFEKNDFRGDDARLRAYARLLASVGVNAVCLNNVNVVKPAQELIGDRFLPKVAHAAKIFAAFGIRLLLSVDYSMPVQNGLTTADPLDETVWEWWRERARLIYRHIPNFCGFLVKADSEFRPGPYTYSRSHAEGANMLARALKPFGGVVVWRCFVYNCRQDWRDTKTDRPMAAYENYAHLDGQFDDNVILQIKNGPFDFQVREPVSPLFYAMPNTRKALEFQLAQEYTGQQIDLYAMQGMFNEVMSGLPAGSVHAISAVSNTGYDACWTGHPFAQLNLYAYGQTAWQPMQSFQETTRRWARLSYGLRGKALDTLTDMLLRSREVYEKYTAPLGICWMVNPNHHYGPGPMGYEYSAWGTYHRADREAVGIDRTAAGTGYLMQYPPEYRKKYETKEACPDNLLLFFYRLAYTYRMRDGRTLIRRIYDDHEQGALEAEALAASLRTLKGALPEGVYAAAAERMDRQLQNAREWRDVLKDFFHRLSGVDA